MGIAWTESTVIKTGHRSLEAFVVGTAFVTLIAAGTFMNLGFRQLSQVVEEKVWFDVFTDLTPITPWRTRWKDDVEHFERIGGCDCHTAQFLVRATRAAINDFPNRYHGFDHLDDDKTVTADGVPE